MSAPRHLGLAERKAQLRLRSGQLREQIAARAQALRPGFRAADRVADGVRAVRALHPLAVALAGALAGVALARPRAALRLGLRLWSGWRMLRGVPPLVSRLLRRR